MKNQKHRFINAVIIGIFAIKIISFFIFKQLF
jgi:hypothetical protein